MNAEITINDYSLVASVNDDYNLSAVVEDYALSAETTDDVGTQLLSAAYRTYIERSDIDNGEVNHIFDECNYGIPLFSRFYSQGFVCPAPMDPTINRRVFPTVYKFGSYSFLSFNAGNSHQIDATNPHVLEFARSDDLWESQELLRIKCIDDGGGVMREIEPLTDGFFAWNYQLAYSDKLYAIIPTFLLTLNPPVVFSDFVAHKTYICSSDDFGETWSTLTELDASAYISSSKPIIVGNEIWSPCYNYDGVALVNIHSYILRWNFVTNSVGAKTQMDVGWVNLSTSEPCLLEYAAGHYMTVSRVNWNANFPGNETIHKGSVIAYSTDGIDWTDYTFYDEGTAFPNQPRLYMYDGYVYYSRDINVLHGTVAGDLSEINWIIRNALANPWYARYSYIYRTFQTSGSSQMERYDPRAGFQDQLRELEFKGSVDFVTWDTTDEIIFVTGSFILDSGVYIGEPWVCVVKRNSVGTGPTYTERLIFMSEIPGDYDVSNAIRIYNFNATPGDTVDVEWLNILGKPHCDVEGVINDQYFIEFESEEEVTNAKLVYEIIK